MISDHCSLIRNSRISDIKVFDFKNEHIAEYYIDIVPECLDVHEKCISEYTNQQLKISFVCHCKCHKKKITIDEILEKLNSNNICLECGNDHSKNEYQNNNKKTSFDVFQELIDNYAKNRMIKGKKIIEVIV
jgi:transcription elongation factor Elf1